MAFAPVTLALGDGRRLLIRPVRPGDAPALGALYDGLSGDDRHLRFFSVFQPPHGFLARMATVEARGGFGLAAFVAGEGPDNALVATADYWPLPNGDGELAITVAAPWRGWLGPYLLDLLAAEASARGVPNFEADVLVANRGMLRLAYSRGAVAVAQSDVTVARVLFATASRTPTWPGPHDRFRLLVEGRGGWAHEPDAERSMQVVVCSRPGPHQPPCRALCGTRCPLAAGADAIVVARRSEGDLDARLRDAHRRLHPGAVVLDHVPDAGVGVVDAAHELSASQPVAAE